MSLGMVVPGHSPLVQMSSGGNQLKLPMRRTRAGLLKENTYDDKLMEMSNKAIENISMLTRNKAHANVLEWDCSGNSQYLTDTPRNFNGTAFSSPRRPISRCSWTNLSVMFSTDTPRQVDGASSAVKTSPVVKNFCYLCSTMEEHQRNHLKLRMTTPLNKDGSLYQKRQRILYSAPAPRRVKRTAVEEDPVTAVQEALYKVTVWTGDIPGGSTDANVYITVIGDQGTLNKTQLWRRQGTNKLAFVRGSKEQFHIKGPKLGNIRVITIEHDGLEKRQSWYLDKIDVQCMLTGTVWLFSCKNWLSMHHGDFTVRRDLEAAMRENVIREFEVIVETGKKRLAGTGAHVYLTLHGTEGSTRKHHLNMQTHSTCFKRGHTNKFKLRFADIGEIRSLRIEHDGEGMTSDCYLSKITLQDLHQSQCVYYFPCNAWLGKDMHDGRLWRDLRALKQLPAEGISSRPVQYDVVLKTGNVSHAGTNANVYVMFTGTSGTTAKIFLDDTTNILERNKMDSFMLKAPNVGRLKSIIIGHDNSGHGAGWFCDYVKIRKYLTRQEMGQYLTRQKQIWKKEQQLGPKSPDTKNLTHQARENREDIEPKEDISNKDLKERTEDAEAFVSDKIEINTDMPAIPEEQTDMAIPTPKENTKKNDKDHSAAMFDQRGRALKFPVCEEYFFPCLKWLASDQFDGLLERELEPSKHNLIYQRR